MSDEMPRIEPDYTPMGVFQRERTEAISEMFDNVDEYGIYPTSRFFVRLDNCVRRLLNLEVPGGEPEIPPAVLDLELDEEVTVS